MKKMSSVSKLLKVNGSPLCPWESWSSAHVPPPPTPSVMYAQITVTMACTARGTPAQPVMKPCQVTLPIIVWRPSVISVISGDTQTKYATSRFVEDAMPRNTWLITAQSTRLPSQTLEAFMEGTTLMTMISTPLWMTTREVRCIEPEAQIYEGGNVTIFFLSHVFFLISIVWYPHFCFAPSYKETNHYLLAFPLYSSSLTLPL